MNLLDRERIEVGRADAARVRRERAGRWAELAAALLLMLKGYRVLARRFATPVGEIDLVARRGRLTIFVEVKRRATAAGALEAVSPRQQRRIARAAELWLRRHPRGPAAEYRCDVVAVAPWRIPRQLRDAWRPFPVTASSRPRPRHGTASAW